ncbi:MULTISPECIES: sodium-extruding oxaloacetate decarboxylase subunit alpha [unclassified Shewanella]|uniref:sodium-extruding oxaloacetate decarboxylase subunit alpha n=1 Tax=unclassified Shewanella TaxID=196818 RepID=UPI000C83F5F5|nr:MULTISPECIES: sodium-extruding oxaloacetate decarboxylase subunit alpha [unclassified Shewanella]MDO6642066.1 sodium-extruding oxaloacetate decarboxylase subunit alpha [Shewanella sp. 5_MG-2023]MDO6679072.1 sodium-extruding oxaloacetate decarboxylase subunit alpha [Shewanella sp. 4_MG-2023]MDO6776381.1 sodium-extruding oxaloacetate decarboxylase subunit alpha [Shewanella sp. 3_MG-2023]PMG44446.1 oxaloacetate decarboxylase subunit alpha [Shewanella sp. 10N.286.52.B9]PMH87159.1 oxaloacetate d
MSKPLALTDVVLRDAHQSILATRLRLDDMLPIAPLLDKIGFWSLESWGGATFDSCIRYLGEDPWDRIRELKKAMPNTPQQMLLRGQNLLGYRHYADDVVTRFVERAHTNGVDVFRIFDAMNDVRNLETAVKAVKQVGGHAQGTISFTSSPVHNVDTWVDMAKNLEDMGCDSLCIKDMAGLLKPMQAYDLISRLKSQTDLTVSMHCHATTGLSTATYQKAIEAGVDILDTAISTMSQTYGHSATETLVAMAEDSGRATGYDMAALEEIAAYFREVRKKYARFEGALKGIDSRILRAQVPGGMLTNMENQLKEQGAADKMDEVLEEIPRVREDLGFLPLVTPTSQIVGTQSVINVLMGERYKTLAKETEGVLKGEYGATPAPVNAELQARVLNGAEAITCRPADLIEPELDKLRSELADIAKKDGITLAAETDDDVMTYALFNQIGLKFLTNRGNPDAFEPVPSADDMAVPAAKAEKGAETYTVNVQGQSFVVEVSEGGDISQIVPTSAAPAAVAPTVAAAPVSDEVKATMNAPLSGNIFKVLVNDGDHVNEGDVVLILEAMKMETEVRAAITGFIKNISVKQGDAVSVGSPLLALA